MRIKGKKNAFIELARKYSLFLHEILDLPYSLFDHLESIIV
jgi:hypothetical protein